MVFLDYDTVSITTGSTSNAYTIPYKCLVGIYAGGDFETASSTTPATVLLVASRTGLPNPIKLPLIEGTGTNKAIGGLQIAESGDYIEVTGLGNTIFTIYLFRLPEAE